MTEQHEIGRLDLASYLAGDCTQQARERIEKHLHDCLSCRRIVEELTKERNAFLAAHPFESLGAPATRRTGGRAAWVRPVYALAATLVLFVAAGLFYNSGRQTTYGVRAKGTTDIEMYVKAEDGSVERRREHVYSPGEYVQIVYSCTRANWFVFLSVDESGDVAVYYPTEGDQSFELEKGQGIPLPNSILLDDYIGRELFVAVFSGHPLSVSSVRSQIISQVAGGKDLDRGDIRVKDAAAVRTILITKRAR